jgi:hypothetical protein
MPEKIYIPQVDITPQSANKPQPLRGPWPATRYMGNDAAWRLWGRVGRAGETLEGIGADRRCKMTWIDDDYGVVKPWRRGAFKARQDKRHYATRLLN